MSAGTFCYSFDNERFEGELSTRADAITAAIAEREAAPGDTIYTGINGEPPSVSRFVPDSGDVLEQMDERASEEYGSEDWPDPRPAGMAAALAALDAAFVVFAAQVQRLDPPSFWHVTEVQPYVVPVTA
jgi:hypothetical protein